MIEAAEIFTADSVVGLAEHLGPVVATVVLVLNARWARRASKATRNGKGDVAHMTSGLVDKVDAVHRRIDNLSGCVTNLGTEVEQLRTRVEAVDDRTIRHDERIRTLFGDLPRRSSRRRWR